MPRTEERRTNISGPAHVPHEHSLPERILVGETAPFATTASVRSLVLSRPSAVWRWGPFRPKGWPWAFGGARYTPRGGFSLRRLLTLPRVEGGISNIPFNLLIFSI